MHIEKLMLKNFGKFNNFDVELAPGLNIIYGANESGKSTLFSFIRGILFGIEKQRGRASKGDVYSKLEPWDNPTFFEGKCLLMKGGAHYILERRFYKGDKYISIVNRDTGVRLSDEETLDFLETFSESRYMSTVNIGQNRSEDEAELVKEIQNCIANLDVSHGLEMDLEAAYKSLRDKKRELNKKMMPELGEELRKTEDRLVLIRHEANEVGQLREETSKKFAEAEERRDILTNRRKSRITLAGTMSVAFVVLLMTILIFIDNKFAWIIAVLASCAATVGVLVTLKLWSRYNRVLKDVEDNLQAVNGEIVRQELLLEQCREREAASELELEALQDKLAKNKELQVEINAVQLAVDTIDEISLQLREEFSGKLNERISQLVEIFTCGEYKEVKMDKDGGIFVVTKDKLVSLEQLSKGTMEQIRLAVRLIVADDVFGLERMPVVFDEAFVYFDDVRLREILKNLSQLDRQIIIFSCHKRESDILKAENIEFKEICL